MSTKYVLEATAILLIFCSTNLFIKPCRNSKWVWRTLLIVVLFLHEKVYLVLMKLSFQLMNNTSKCAFAHEQVNLGWMDFGLWVIHNTLACILCPIRKYFRRNTYYLMVHGVSQIEMSPSHSFLCSGVAMPSETCSQLMNLPYAGQIWSKMFSNFYILFSTFPFPKTLDLYSSILKTPSSLNSKQLTDNVCAVGSQTNHC